MKKVLLKTLLISLGCAGAMNAPAHPLPAETRPTFRNLPLFFEAAAVGQADHPTRFIARGGDCQFLISPTGARLELMKVNAVAGNESLRTVQMQFVGAGSQPQIHGAGELTGKVNYLIGSDPSRWHTGVATYARVQVEQLYPGVNLVYYGNQQQLEYDFVIAPGANPNEIKIHFGGVDKISIDAKGELILALGAGEIRQPAPVIFQSVRGRRQIVSGGYRLVGVHTVAFVTGKYDHRSPLVIDPILSFSTYFGGGGNDMASAIAMDTNGFIYLAGQTTSAGLATPGAFQTNFAGGAASGDAFVAKFGPSGTNLLWCTYLGGKQDDLASSLAVDQSGDVFLTGFTDSTNFPTTNALYPQILGHNYGRGYYNGNAFVAELDPAGSNLVYSTYLGGSGITGNAVTPGGSDEGLGIAVDSAGNAYVTGYTSSTNFPVVNPLIWQLSGTNNTFNHLAGIYNTFLAKIGPGGTNLLYSTYFGGTNVDVGTGVAVDPAGAVYLTGYTDSPNFPTNNPVQPYFGGATNPVTSYDAFVARFAQPTSTNLSLIYSTFLGGTNSSLGYGIAADANGNAYVVGGTASFNFPNSATNVPGLYEGVTNNLTAGSPYITNAFLTQIRWNGTNAAIGYSAVFGGTNAGIDIGYGVVLDASGDPFVVGASSTASFPVANSPGMLGAANAGGSDAFVIGFNASASAILYSGYLGGAGNDYGYGIAVDSSTNIYVVGQTASANFPTLNPYQPSLKGSSDAFLAEIGWVNEAPAITTQPPTNQMVATGTTVTFPTVVTGTPPLTLQWQEQGTNSLWTNLVNRGNISGATNATLTISNAQTTNSGSYRLIVTNLAGSTDSSVAKLTVTNAFPLITTQPKSQTVGVGGGSSGYASFSVSVSGGTSPVTYQWMKDGTNLVNGGTNLPGAFYPNHIYGATNTTLYVVDPQTNDEGTYWLAITNPAGVELSSNATLAVVAFPTIITPPMNQTVGLGSTLTFGVTAIGSGTLGYQWQLDGTSLSNGTNADGSVILGATTPTLQISDARTSNDGGYAVIVTNSVGSVTSSPPAVLTVLTVPTFMSITAGADGSFVVSGTGGTNGANYTVLASTNLALPLSQWQVISFSGSPQFGSQGQFMFTNTPPANTPQRFYIMELPPP